VEQNKLMPILKQKNTTMATFKQT